MADEIEGKIYEALGVTRAPGPTRTPAHEIAAPPEAPAPEAPASDPEAA